MGVAASEGAWIGSPQEKDVVDQSSSNGCIAVAAGHNTLADEVNRKEQDQNNYLAMLDYNFCKTVVSEWTKGRVQDQKSSGLGDQLKRMEEVGD